MSDIEDLFKITQGTKHLRLAKKIQISELQRNCVKELVSIILTQHNDPKIKLTNPKVHTLIQKLCSKYKQNEKMRLFKINYIIRQMIDNDEINHEELSILNIYLRAKKMRSQSGILEIAIVTSPGEFSCAYDCYYCPNQPGMPRSYVKEGPSLLRAAENGFDIVRQFYDRGSTYAVNLHNVDKVEVILLGGTWDSYDISYQERAITEVYYAANTFYSENPRPIKSLEEEKKINETTLCKIVGITIETRPDQITPEQLLRCLRYGVTRIQIGIQHTNNSILKKINRQCSIERVYEACYMIKEANIKLQTHWMPNLPGATPDLDKEMFDELNYNPLLSSDDIKIYPTIVTTTSKKDINAVYTVIEKWYLEGKYEPYDNETLKEVIMYGKIHIGEEVRISRVFRDIPKPNIIGGADEPNMRQELTRRLKEQGLECECIRCREVKDKIVNPEDISIRVKKFEASKSTEYFISAVSFDKKENDRRVIHGFIRLRIPHIKDNHFIEELQDCALIREVHVYGELIPTFDIDKNLIINDEVSAYLKSMRNNQHRGLGKKLVMEAEKIALNHGYHKYAIISGVGVREYYRRQGYRLQGAFMIKDIQINTENCDNYRYLFNISIFAIIILILSIFYQIYMINLKMYYH